MPTLVTFAVIVVCWLICIPLSKRSQRECLRRVFVDEQESLNNQVLNIDESGISCNAGDGLAISHHTWDAFRKRIDLPDAYLFLPTPNSFIRVPKDILPTADLELIWQWSSAVKTVEPNSR